MYAYVGASSGVVKRSLRRGDDRVDRDVALNATPAHRRRHDFDVASQDLESLRSAGPKPVQLPAIKIEAVNTAHVDWIEEQRRHLKSLTQKAKAPEPLVLEPPEPEVEEVPDQVAEVKPKPVAEEKPKKKRWWITEARKQPKWYLEAPRPVVMPKAPEPVVAKAPKPVVEPEAPEAPEAVVEPKASEPVVAEAPETVVVPKAPETVVMPKAPETVVAKAPESVVVPKAPEPVVAKAPESVVVPKAPEPVVAKAPESVVVPKAPEPVIAAEPEVITDKKAEPARKQEILADQKPKDRTPSGRSRSKSPARRGMEPTNLPKKSISMRSGVQGRSNIIEAALNAVTPDPQPTFMQLQSNSLSAQKTKESSKTIKPIDVEGEVPPVGGVVSSKPSDPVEPQKMTPVAVAKAEPVVEEAAEPAAAPRKSISMRSGVRGRSNIINSVINSVRPDPRSDLMAANSTSGNGVSSPRGAGSPRRYNQGELQKKTVKQLKSMLGEMNLKTSGRKKDLIGRILRATDSSP